MEILYKYYSPNFDVIGHLTSPSMKLSHVSSFNDPFERSLPAGHIENVINNLMVAINNDDESVKREFRKNYENANSLFGVIPLSETHRNVLMWAHYANSHRGVCIGYKSNFFDGLEKLPSVFDSLNVKYSPQRVVYDSMRFDPERLSYSPEQLYISLKKKSDEWIYEKEHRCIIPLIWADKMKVSALAKSKLASTIEMLISEGRLSKGDEENEFTFTKNQHSYADKSDFSSLHDEISMLKNINTNSIDSIYLGSLHDGTQANKIYEFMNASPEKYSHISLYKYDVDKNEFKLNITPLLNGKFES